MEFQRLFEILLLVETSCMHGRGIIEGVSAYAVEQGGSWVVYPQNRSLNDGYPSWLKKWSGDGIIARSNSDSMVKAIRKTHIPCVELLGTKTPDVTVDEKSVSRMAAVHFLDRGLKNFAFFGHGTPWWSHWRRQNFNLTLQEHGFHTHVFKSKHRSKLILPSWNATAEAELVAWLRWLPKPIGLLCSTDIEAIIATGACRRAGVSVPEEVAVLGVDNDQMLCHATNPQISSIDLNAFLVGYRAAELLHKRILKTDDGTKLPILTQPAFIETRMSTDMIAVNDEDVAEALRFIRCHTASVTVTDITHHLCISQSTLYRKFKKSIGRSPEHEIIRTKLNLAKQLLLQTQLSLGSIAAKTGFSPLPYFVGAFKKGCGVTPMVFRKEQKYPRNQADKKELK